MAIDTYAKRISAACSRRLPWLRRFFPRPTGSMTVADRQQAGFMYNGFVADDPSLPAIELSATIDRTAEIEGKLLR